MMLLDLVMKRYEGSGLMNNVILALAMLLDGVSNNVSESNSDHIAKRRHVVLVRDANVEMSVGHADEYIVSGYIDDGSHISIKVKDTAPKVELIDGQTFAILYKDDKCHWYGSQLN